MGDRQENSLRTVRSNSQFLYTNTGWSVHMFRVGLYRVHRWGPLSFREPLAGTACKSDSFGEKELCKILIKS